MYLTLVKVMIFRLTAMGRLPMFRALPAGAAKMLFLGLGCVAQLVEHLTFNQRVLGSNPSAATTHFKLCFSQSMRRVVRVSF